MDAVPDFVIPFVGQAFERQLNLQSAGLSIGQGEANGCGYDIDVFAGLLSLSDGRELSVQLLGSLSEPNGTWIWAWGNEPMVSRGLKCTHSLAMLEYGQEHGIKHLTEHVTSSVSSVGVHWRALMAVGLLDLVWFACSPAVH